MPTNLRPKKKSSIGMTDREAIREAYHMGFSHALDAVLEGLKGNDFIDPVCALSPGQVIEKLRQRQSVVQMSVAIAKASQASKG